MIRITEVVFPVAGMGKRFLTPHIFEGLENVMPSKGSEIQLADSVAALLQRAQALAYRFAGKRYDCGSKLGYMKANVAFASRHPESGPEFATYLQQLGQQA